MKKLYIMLIICINLPLSVLASNSDIKVGNGVREISVQPECGIPD